MKAALQSCGFEPASPFVRAWEMSGPFAELFRSIETVTLMDRQRCYLLYCSALQSQAVPGATAEVGVYRGGTAFLLARARPGTPMYLFDTFAGMPRVRPDLDLHRSGDFADTSLDAARRFVASETAVFRPGVFPSSAAGLEGERFSLVHVDCDIYDSVRACCEWFYPRLAPGGLLVFDDYGWPSCPGVRTAVDEFFATRPECPLPVGQGQALVVRLPENAPPANLAGHPGAEERAG
ncbi:MAG: TylF/MycF/NovP-related O-methyltransferase [Terriglobales bacterium]